MRVSTLATFFALASLSACHQVPAPEKKPEASLVSATSENCQNVCQHLSVVLHVKNNSGALYCLSGRYYDDATAFVGIKGPIGDEHQYLQTPRDYVIDPLFSEDTQKIVSSLRRGSQIVLQPNEAQNIPLTMINSFDFPSGNPETAHVKVYMYPCADSDFKLTGATALDVSGPVTMHIVKSEASSDQSTSDTQ